MEWWDKVTHPIRRFCVGVATRLGIRKNGHLKLKHEVRSCEYEDVRVMWEMLRKTDVPPTARSSVEEEEKRRGRHILGLFEWASCRAPFLCRGF
ncbi:hypothetical protein QJS10_CPB13g00417 [Acorus calamus]|uniref:Uncharacterized protein n=1 Tax=Acorus calamus TaxID=4465 RepID=A0AAV9DFC8_ACOCL|nr:hypothetical protein QJS10_CPB13g00417 [Acorus calamus]